jgi:hypothetical protein
MPASDHGLVLEPARRQAPRRAFSDRVAEQVAALSVRSEPLGFLVLLFVVWLAMQALRALGKAL